MSIGSPGESTAIPFSPTTAKPAILVVDEDPAFQLGLKTFLREYVGFSDVFTAKTGAEALEKIESEPSIELITLDYQMPGMNGIEMMEELSRTLPRPLSVTMITGYPSDELEEEFRSFRSPRLLADHFLSKPVEFERLEPVMLRAYEDLENAKRNTEEESEIPADESEVPIAGGDPIREQLSRQSQKLEEIEKKIEELRYRWRLDFWKLVGVGLLIWAALHFGWIESMKPLWNTVKSNLASEVERFSAPTPEAEAPAGTTNSEPAPPDTGQGATSELENPAAPSEAPDQEAPVEIEPTAPTDGRPL